MILQFDGEMITVTMVVMETMVVMVTMEETSTISTMIVAMKMLVPMFDGDNTLQCQINGGF